VKRITPSPVPQHAATTAAKEPTVKFKPILGSDLSGHIGGVVASHNTYGPYLRQRVKPVNKKTPAQQAQRAAIAAISQTWRTLDPTVQASWVAASVTKTSKKGDKVVLTGAAAFQFVNTLRFRLGLTLVTSPPSGTTTPTLTPPSIAITGAYTLSLTLAADAWNANGGGLIISAGLLTSNGRSYSTPSVAVTGLLGPQTIPVTVNLPFSIPIGARARLLFHATDPDGRQSTYQTVDVLNPSFPPAPIPPLTALEVTLIGLNTYLWRFDRAMTKTTGADPHLIVDGDTTGVSVSVGPALLSVVYTTASSATVPWSIDAQPTSITDPVLVPQSGTTD
jgi:hypothetical protein